MFRGTYRSLDDVVLHGCKLRIFTHDFTHDFICNSHQVRGWYHRRHHRCYVHLTNHRMDRVTK